ncbi:PAS domain-containing protein, partial [Escherichia coli]|nr:PAS domain-containing protein [Escherichia coli]
GQNFSESLSYGWVEMLHPDDRERVKTAYEYALATGTPVALELQIRDREGFYRHFTARGIPIPTGSGRRPRWICALTDITRQRAAEEMLRESE